MANTIRFTVFGKPQQRGSKQPVFDKNGQPRKTAKGRPLLIDNNKRSDSWMQECRAAARNAFAGDLLRNFLDVRLTFYFLRPQSHYGSGRNLGMIKATAPRFPSVKDIDKLARAVNDSLTGVVYIDDRIIADQTLRKRYGEPERVEIEINPYPEVAVKSPTKELFA